MSAARRMGDFVPVPDDACLCDHGLLDHGNLPLTSPCMVDGCGCADFDYAEEDNDYVPGFDDGDDL